MIPSLPITSPLPGTGHPSPPTPRQSHYRKPPLLLLSAPHLLHILLYPRIPCRLNTAAITSHLFTTVDWLAHHETPPTVYRLLRLCAPIIVVH